MVRELCTETNNEVIALCRPGAISQTAKQSGTRINWVEADISRPIDTAQLPSRIDAVIHLAQSRHYRNFPESAADIVAVNISSTAQLLDYAYKAGADWFFHASTGSVYEPYGGPFHEDAQLDPKDFYAISKLAAEKLSLSYQGEMNVCVHRLFCLYGANALYGLVKTLIDRIRCQSVITLDGDAGGLRFTPTYVSDVASVISTAMSEKWNGVYNVASLDAVSIEQLSNIIAGPLDVDPLFERTGAPDPLPLIPDLTKMINVLPEQRFTSIHDGILKAIESQA